MFAENFQVHHPRLMDVAFGRLHKGGRPGFDRIFIFVDTSMGNHMELWLLDKYQTYKQYYI